MAAAVQLEEVTVVVMGAKEVKVVAKEAKGRRSPLGAKCNCNVEIVEI
jgi:hypothetical protein